MMTIIKKGLNINFSIEVDENCTPLHDDMFEQEIKRCFDTLIGDGRLNGTVSNEILKDGEYEYQIILDEIKFNSINTVEMDLDLNVSIYEG